MTSPATPFRVGLVQHCAGRDMARNIEEVSALIERCVADGAEFVSTPEMTHLMETSTSELHRKTSPQDRDPGVLRFSDLAAELGIWLNIGSLAVQSAPGRLSNRSFLFAPDGRIEAYYDKIHMFDVKLGDGEHYAESRQYAAGNHAVLAELPWGGLGMTVCYDMRFPGLYRRLAGAGADFLTVPAAFTVPTGKAHWHTLLRARAIETGCFVFAAAQVGRHECGRETFGHGLIVSPWGEILAEATDGAGTVVADIDPDEVKAARERIPTLTQERLYGLLTTGNELKAVS